jgi:Tfp pilus assembly protein PilE
MLITMAVIGILACAAISGYREYVMRSNQAHAKSQLMAIAQAEEIFRYSNNGYTSDKSQLTNCGWRDQYGKYKFTLSGATENAFLAVASADLNDDGKEDDVWTIDENNELHNTLHAW